MDSETNFVRLERRGPGCKKCTQTKTTGTVYMTQRMQKQEQDQWDHQPEAGFWSRLPFQKISITSSVYETGCPPTKLFLCSWSLVDLTTLVSLEEDDDDDNEN